MPDVVVEEVVPDIGLFDSSDNKIVHEPVNKVPSSPIKVTVISKLKYAVGDEMLDKTVKDDNKLVTVAGLDVAEEMLAPDVAIIENVPADKILSPLKVI